MVVCFHLSIPNTSSGGIDFSAVSNCAASLEASNLDKSVMLKLGAWRTSWTSHVTSELDLRLLLVVFYDMRCQVDILDQGQGGE